MKVQKKLEIFTAITDTELELPFVDAGISAGFPSPALDFVEMTIDMNKFLVKNPSATFYGRVKGISLSDIGIDDGDILVIDRSLEPGNGKLAVCCIDDEFTAKRIKVDKTGIWLLPENDHYKPIRVNPESNFTVWGIVTFVIKDAKYL